MLFYIFQLLQLIPSVCIFFIKDLMLFKNSFVIAVILNYLYLFLSFWWRSSCRFAMTNVFRRCPRATFGAREHGVHYKRRV